MLKFKVSVTNKKYAKISKSLSSGKARFESTAFIPSGYVK
jgi:hypothetical protein